MTNENISTLADQALVNDLEYRKELFKWNFSLDALTYLKYEMLNRLRLFQNEQEYFGRQIMEVARKQSLATDNVALVKEELQAIEEILIEKKNKIAEQKKN